ncbi:MAG: hypothetical protein KGZ83_05100 [Sulfuricella sp.]|nr:hypothetical protein [Sulfuricella sp.]
MKKMKALWLAFADSRPDEVRFTRGLVTRSTVVAQGKAATRGKLVAAAVVPSERKSAQILLFPVSLG